ncbi:MAG: DUF4214 domain-containing protein [Novosphingobium sp.]
MSSPDEPALLPADRITTAARRPGISDVARGFRLFLGREVESVAVAGVHIAGAPDHWDLVEAIWGSPEARHRRLAESLRDVRSVHDLVSPVANASGQQLDELYHAACDRWRKHGLGRYHQALTREMPRYSDRSVRWSLEPTLDRGSAEWNSLLRFLDRRGWRGGSEVAVTVLGVEAYRMLGAGQSVASALVAIELLEGDVARGRHAEQIAQVRAARFLHLAESRDGLPPTDLFYSVSALQYAPPPVILDALRQCLSSVKAGGWAVFQLPSHLHSYGFDATTYLSSEEEGVRKDLHCVAQADVLALLADEGFRIHEVIPDERVSVFGVSYTYVARRGPAPSDRNDRPGASVCPNPDTAGCIDTGDRVTAETIVQLLYRSLLGRAADAEGLAHYAGMMREGALDSHTLTSILVQSPEYRQSMDARHVLTGHFEIDAAGCRLAVPATPAIAHAGEPWVLPYYLDHCRPGSAVLDLGARIGIFSLPAAQRVQAAGRVYASETNSRDFAFLAHNTALNRLVNVELLQIASPDVGSVAPGVAATGPENDGVVSTLSIDCLGLLLRKIDLLRVSAAAINDGSLEGAIRRISDDLPTVFLEYAPPIHDAKFELHALQFLNFCIALGYRVEVLHRRQPRQFVEGNQIIATVKQAWKVHAHAGDTHLDLCLRPPVQCQVIALADGALPKLGSAGHFIMEWYI